MITPSYNCSFFKDSLSQKNFRFNFSPKITILALIAITAFGALIVAGSLVSAEVAILGAGIASAVASIFSLIIFIVENKQLHKKNEEFEKNRQIALAKIKEDSLRRKKNNEILKCIECRQIDLNNLIDKKKDLHENYLSGLEKTDPTYVKTEEEINDLQKKQVEISREIEELRKQIT